MKKLLPFLAIYFLAAVTDTHAQSWLIDGNAGIDTTKHFFGTTDNADIIFKRNNTRAGMLQMGNTAFGVYALAYANTGTGNTGIGTHALSVNTTGNYNTATGRAALHHNTTGSYNTASGAMALDFNITGDYNAAHGYYALHANTTGNHNTAQGYAALGNNTTANYNTAYGSFTMWKNFTGTYNTAIGYAALYENEANNNSAVGTQAIYNNTTGHDNTAIGYKALYASTTGDYNTAAGMNAFSSGNFNNSTAIGYNTNITASNQVRLGNNAVTSIGGFAGWTNVSDARFKKETGENIPGLSFILKLRPVSYYLNMDEVARFMHIPDSLRLRDAENEKSKILQTGFMAQEVEKASLELGFDFSGIDKPKTKDDYYGLRYAEFVVPLVKGMQEQQQELEKEKQKVKQLETVIQQMEQRLKLLEQKIGSCPVL